MKFCYASALGDCAGVITGEHYISRGVLDLISYNDSNPGIAVLNGPRWQNKAIAIDSLVANILCEHHNGLLSPLDSTAKQMFEAVQHVRSRAVSGLHIAISKDGHYFERWLLKMLCGVMASGNSFRDDRRLTKQPPSITFLRVLFGMEPFSDGCGFYFTSNSILGPVPAGQDFGFAPLSRNGEHIGFVMSMTNLGFYLAMRSQDTSCEGLLKGAVYRPSFLQFTNASTNNQAKITLLWDQHRAESGVTINFIPIPDVVPNVVVRLE